VSFTDEERFSQAPDVVSRVLDGEAVLLDLASGKYLGLNAVATRAWELFGAGKTLGEVRAALLDEFEVARDVLDRDLTEMLEDMQSRGLIVLQKNA
jgi:Coenzyme PQQ synthesis protein D (PqqD)